MSPVNSLIRKAMITTTQSLNSECPFLTLQGMGGSITIHFAPKRDPRVTWNRGLSVKDGVKMGEMFRKRHDPDNLDNALELIEYTLFHYVTPERKVISGSVHFVFTDGIIGKIEMTGQLVYEDCVEGERSQ